ncbi:hypothetical protein QQ045_002881 [Rhodiola kirilowii]
MMKFKDDVLKAKLGNVAYAKELKFKNKFAELLQLLHDKPLARKWLEDMDVELRTHAFDHGGFRWGSMTTNASECLNKILKNGRDFPVSSLLADTPGLKTQIMSPQNIRSKRTTGPGVIFSTPYFTRIFGEIIMDLFMFRIQDSNVTKLADPRSEEGVTRWTSNIDI